MRRSSSGFTLIEVAISMGILGLALGVLMDGAYLSTSVRMDVRQLTRATLLARAVMAEIEYKLQKDGFGFSEKSESCDFRVKGLEGFACEYSVNKVELPIGDLIQKLFTAGGDPSQALAALGGGLSGGSSTATGTTGTSGATGTPPIPGMAPGTTGGLAAAAAGALGANPGLAANALQLYASQMQEILEEAMREVRLTISWKVGKKKWESLVVVTHLVEIAKAGVSGADQLAGQLSQQHGLSAPTGAALQGGPGAPGMPLTPPGGPR